MLTFGLNASMRFVMTARATRQCIVDATDWYCVMQWENARLDVDFQS